MRFLTVDSVGFVVGLLLQAALCLVIFRKGLARLYPIFVLYLLLNLVEDPLGWFLRGHVSAYRHFYFIVTILDYVLQLLIIFEIGQTCCAPRGVPSTFQSCRLPL